MNNTMEDGLIRESNLVYALVYGCILALGLPLNAVSLWILLRRHSLKSPSVVFMVNLAISDLLLAITLPMRVYFYATGTWPLSPEACIWTTMLFRSNIRSSSIFITFISVDRLLAVIYPLRSRHLRTASNTLKAVVLAWLFVLALNTPQTLEFSNFIKRKNDNTCFEFQRGPNVTNDNSKHRYHKSTFTTYLPSVLAFILLAVNIVCTTSVSWTLRSDSARVNNKVNVMLIFVMNLVMFIICFLPMMVHLLFLGLPVSTPLVCLASFNCCLDPLLYYFSLDAFWKNKEDIELAREPDHRHTISM